MKKQCLILAISSLFLFATAAGAGTVSVTPTGPYTAETGDLISFEVFFTADADGDLLKGVTLNVAYDADELSFESYETMGVPAFMELFGQAEDSITTEGENCVMNYNQATMGAGSPIDVGANESIRLGTFNFTADADLVFDGVPDLWLIDDVTQESTGLIYSSLVAYNDVVEYTSVLLANEEPDVGAVPVPAAAWLLGSGILGLVGVSRRRKD
ncbi:MAG: hypothetical protein CSB34_02200 [Desulfobulbus propionicus]|nr:MAG: hypothetical protein CSB34_02200 [Desulfobulbus propionicus]